MMEDRREQAADRARAARERAEELEELRTRVQRGEHLTASDLRRAQQAVADADEHAARAFVHASEAHQRAATAHRRFADLLDRLGQHERAQVHRRQALEDEAGADRDIAEAVFLLP